MFISVLTLSHRYIGTRFGPIAEAIGMPNLYDEEGGEDYLFPSGKGTKRPSKRMGPTGAGVDR